MTGAKTVLRVYARNVIDERFDLYGMSLGYGHGREEWDRRKAEYLGQCIAPEAPVRDSGRH